MTLYNCSSMGLSTNTTRHDQQGFCEDQRVVCGSNVSWTLANVSAEDLANMCLSLSEHFEKCRGPRRSPVFLPICVTYLLIFLVGALGNTLTCVVIIQYKVMWTPINYYLFSLAVSDLLVLLLGMPLELYDMWSNYPFVLGTGGCYFKTFLFETVCLASILNVMALSVERYIAVVHPLKVKHVATRTHAKRVILALWCLSMLCAVPNTSLHGIDTLASMFGCHFPESAICTLVKPVWMYNLIIQVTTLLFFLLPMLTISVLYLRICLQLRREKREKGLHVVGTRPGFGPDSHSSKHRQQQRARHQQVTKMLCVLVVAFGICWAPFHIDRFMYSYINSWTEEHFQIFEYIHIVSGVFFYLSSVVNPILYNLMSTRFREMFRQVMCRYFPCNHQEPRLTISSSHKQTRCSSVY